MLTRGRFAVAAGSAAAASLAPGLAFAQTPSANLPLQIVDAFNKLFGSHAGYRANHAKGIVCNATFVPTPAAATLSSAAHFSHPVKATVRFSDFGGLPTVPDADPLASPHGLAVKFHLPGSGDTDLVGHSSNLFPVANGADFLAFLTALAASPPTATHPNAVEQFAQTHPAAARFLQAPNPPPVSFATLSYYMIDAFKFTSKDGHSRFARYEFHPAGGQRTLSAEAAAKAPPNYLIDEIKKRLASAPAKFTMALQIADPGDKTSDPTVVWPPTRRVVRVGTLTVTGVVPNSDAVQRQLLFDPVRLTDGIALTDDPLPTLRSQAYAISYARRLGAK
jgi:catalase